MKEPNSDILNRIARRDGMKVPDGYFAAFADKMIQDLPEKAAETAKPRTMWMKVRPYVYMAAMFAGVWCMLKMFTLMSAPIDGSPLDTNPILAEAVSNEEFVNEYIINDMSQWDVIDEMISDSIDYSDINWDEWSDSIPDLP